MKIAIIDDLVECRDDIQSCLHRFFSKHYVEESIHIEEYISSEDFLFIFRKDSYQVWANGYLLKPFSYEDFEQTLLLLNMA